MTEPLATANPISQINVNNRRLAEIERERVIHLIEAVAKGADEMTMLPDLKDFKVSTLYDCQHALSWHRNIIRTLESTNAELLEALRQISTILEGSKAQMKNQIRFAKNTAEQAIRHAEEQAR